MGGYTWPAWYRYNHVHSRVSSTLDNSISFCTLPHAVGYVYDHHRIILREALHILEGRHTAMQAKSTMSLSCPARQTRSISPAVWDTFEAR